MATRIDVVRRALRHIGRLDLVSNPVAEHQEYAVSTLLSLLAELRTRLIVWWLPADDDSLIPDIALGPLSEALGGRIAGALFSDRATGRTGNLQAEGMAAEGRLMIIRPTGFVVSKAGQNVVKTPSSTSYSEIVGNGTSNQFVITHALNDPAPVVAITRVASPFDVTTAYTAEILSPNSIIIRFTSPPAAGQWRVTVT